MSNTKYTTISSLKSIKEQSYRKIVSGIHTVEDIPTLIKHYEDQIAGIDGATMEVNEQAGRIDFNNGQFVMLPKMKKEATGLLSVRSGGDYVFADSETGKPSYGQKLNKKNVIFTDTGFAVKYDNGMIITFTPC